LPNGTNRHHGRNRFPLGTFRRLDQKFSRLSGFTALREGNDVLPVSGVALRKLPNLRNNRSVPPITICTYPLSVH
jgi:hypothetical protein